MLKCTHTDQERKTSPGRLFYVVSNWRSSWTLQKICWISSHCCQPLGISVRVPWCGTLTLSFLWQNKMAMRESQTCRICLILIFSTCPASSDVGAKTNVFHNATKCSHEMIHYHFSCFWIAIIPPQKVAWFSKFRYSTRLTAFFSGGLCSFSLMIYWMPHFITVMF